MTISYNEDIASSSPVSFLKVLCRWKASVWKSVLIELTVWTCAYLSISVLYRFGLTVDQQKIFERIADYCEKGVKNIPLTFLLGFFVNIVVQRWTDAFKNMGYLENQAIHISSMITGDDYNSRLIRRTMARYLCLAQVLVFRDLSIRVRKRFPTMESLVKGGFMMDHEKQKMDAYRLDYDKYWVPLNWSIGLLMKARKDGLIIADTYALKICDQITTFRNNLQMLCNYDWVEIPLVYPQVVFLSVHTYFVVCLIGRQYIIGVDAPNKSQIDVIFPIMTMLQYLFFVGWMKVAESLLNPFGEDDDDFECNFLIDKNLATSLCIVDEAHDDIPEMEKDLFWSSSEVDPLYSVSSASIPNNPLMGSAARAAGTNLELEEPEMVARDPFAKRAVTTMGRNKRNTRFENFMKRFSTSRVGAVQSGEVMGSVDPSNAIFRLDQLQANNPSQTVLGAVPEEQHHKLSTVPDRVPVSPIRHARFAPDPQNSDEPLQNAASTSVTDNANRREVDDGDNRSQSSTEGILMKDLNTQHDINRLNHRSL